MLEEHVELVKATRDRFQTIFSIIAKMGKLSAVALNLNVKVYDYETNYAIVKNMWLGFEE